MPITNQSAQETMEKVRAYLEQSERSEYGVQPWEQNLADDYPGADPTGCCSGIEVRFRREKELIERCVAGKWPEVQWYVKGIFQTENARRLQESVQAISREMREVRLAEKLCPDEEGREELSQRLRELRLHPDLRTYGALLHGAEAALGLSPVKLSLQERRLLLENGTPYSERMAQTGALYNRPFSGPVQFDFPNQERIDQASGRMLENGPDGGLTERLEAPSGATARRRMEGYAMDLSQRTLAPFEPLPGGVPLEERIIINGKTARELLDRDQIGRALPPERRQEVRRQELYKRVGAALMAQPPMEMELFQELEPGKLSPEPLSVVGTGYRPREPYYMSLWERLCHAIFGAYKEEAERERQTKVWEAAREQVLQRHPERAAAQSAPLKQLRLAGNDAYQKIVDARDLAQAQYDGLLAVSFPDGDPNGPYPYNPNKDVFAGREAPASLLMGILAADGHSLEDILDPTRLGAEKRQAAQELRRHVEDGDLTWYTGKMHKGCQKLSELLEKKLKATDLTDDDALTEAHPALHLLAQSVSCLSQELDKPELKKELGGQLGEEQARSLIDAYTNIGLQGGIAADELLGAKQDLYESTLGLRKGGNRAHTTAALRRLLLSDSTRHKMAHLLRSGVALKDIHLTQPFLLAQEVSMDAKMKAALDPLEENTPQAEEARCKTAMIALKGDYQALKLETPIRARFGSNDPLTRYRAEVHAVHREETPEAYQYRRRMSQEIQEIKDALEGFEQAGLALDRDLFGGKLPKSVNTSVRTDRTMPRNFCIAQLLRKGCSMEDIMDPNKLKDEKQATAAEFSRNVEAGNVAWVADEMYEGLKAAKAELAQRVRQEGERGLTDDRNLLAKTDSLYTLGRLCFDLGQEVQVRSNQEGGGIREHLDAKLPAGELSDTISSADRLACMTDGIYQKLRSKAALFDAAMEPDAKIKGSLPDFFQDYLLGKYAQERSGAGLARGEAPDRLIDDRNFIVGKSFVTMDPVVTAIGNSLVHKDPQARQAARMAVAKAMLEGTLPKLQELQVNMDTGEARVEITRDTPLERQAVKLTREGDERARSQAQPARQAPKKSGPQKSK